MAKNERREPYRIVRGSLTRREEGTFVTYTPKTLDNPGAKNEVMLTPTEARNFQGRSIVAKLEKLVRGEVRTGQGITSELPERHLPPRQGETDEETDDENGSDDGSKGGPDETFEEFRERVAALVKEGEAATGGAETAKFRKKVAASQLLTEVPTKKDEVLDALRALIQQ